MLHFGAVTGSGLNLGHEDMRFLLYSHDGMGLGHTRRHLAIAAALGELAPDASIMLATGADEVNRLGLPPCVEVLKLPSLRKLANEQYASRRLQIPTSEIRALRSALLAATVKSFKPTVVLVDKHPFGAAGEFQESLDVLKTQGGTCVLGLRDILDAPETVLREWEPHRLQQRIEEYYDDIFVYGQRAVFDPVKEYDFSPSMAARTRFCGYIVNRPDAQTEGGERLRAFIDASEKPVVLATSGGGEDGFMAMETFLRAAIHAPWQGVVVAGPMTPEAEFAVLQRLAIEAGVIFHTFIPNLSSWFWLVDALVCMGGYNTITEAMSTGVPTVCIPRVRPRTEQLIRAEAFAKLGLLHCLPPRDCTPGSLARSLALAMGTPRDVRIARANDVLNFDGARQAASHMLALCNSVRDRRARQTAFIS